MRVIFLVAAVFFSVFLISSCAYSNYRFERDVLSNWELADKASTIPQKREYIDRFMEVVEHTSFANHNALIFKTPNNSTEENINALKSLQKRLQEIETMDVKSFEYQTAIQQITAQEQGEANQILLVLRGAWQLDHFWWVWAWVGVLMILLNIFLYLISVKWEDFIDFMNGK